MGNDESRFNVSLIVRDKVTRQCPQTTTFLKRKEIQCGIEPRPFCLPALRLTAEPKRPKVQELCESRGAFRPNEPYGFCGRKITLNLA